MSVVADVSPNPRVGGTENDGKQEHGAGPQEGVVKGCQQGQTGRQEVDVE